MVEGSESVWRRRGLLLKNRASTNTQDNLKELLDQVPVGASIPVTDNNGEVYFVTKTVNGGIVVQDPKGNIKTYTARDLAQDINTFGFPIIIAKFLYDAVKTVPKPPITPPTPINVPFRVFNTTGRVIINVPKTTSFFGVIGNFLKFGVGPFLMSGAIGDPLNPEQSKKELNRNILESIKEQAQQQREKDMRLGYNKYTIQVPCTFNDGMFWGRNKVVPRYSEGALRTFIETEIDVPYDPNYNILKPKPERYYTLQCSTILKYEEFEITKNY